MIIAGKGQGFTLTALPAGHTVGGAIWQVATPAEEHIIYAPDFNHQREAHLNAGSLDSCSPRPAVLICGAKVHPGSSLGCPSLLAEHLLPCWPHVQQPAARVTAGSGQSSCTDS